MRAAQLAVDQRADDLQAEPVAGVEVEPVRQAAPVVGHDDVSSAGPAADAGAPSTVPPSCLRRSPCSTAFCSSSVSTIDQRRGDLGAAASPKRARSGRTPHRASRPRPTSADHRQQPVRRSRRSRPARPATVDRVSCTIAIDATRRTDSSSAAARVRRRPPAGPAGAAARPRSAGCSSPGGGSPGWWRPWSAAARSRRRTSVTSRTSTSAPIGTPGGQQRQRPEQHGRARAPRPPSAAGAVAGSAALIRSPTSAALERVAGISGRVSGASSSPTQVAGRGPAAGTPTARSGWRRRPCRRRRAGSARRRPAGAECTSPGCPRRREGAVGDHLGQVVRGGQVVQLQLARRPRGATGWCPGRPPR